jgi:signal transduction histidine kinase
MIIGSIRLRMMLLFFAVVGFLLAGSCFGYYALLRREVRAQLDRELRGAAGPVLRDLVSEPNSQDVNELNLTGEYFEVVDSAGHVLQFSKNLQQPSIPLDGITRSARAISFRTVEDKHRGTLRLCVIPFVRGGDTLFFLVAVGTSEAEQVLATFRRVSLFLLPFSMLLTALISTWYVGKILKPIAVLTEHASHMTHRVSDPQRKDEWLPLPVGNPRDELGRLAATFNALLTHVDSALTQLRQFVTDASHELRTPLSVLQVETELLLSDSRLPEDYRKTVTVLHDELKTLSRIVEGLFTLAIADAGQLRLETQPLYLSEVLEETCLMADQLARPKSILIERQLCDEILYFGDEAFLRELFLIFLENAIKYSSTNTRVRVWIEQTERAILVSFEDQGVGIAPRHLPHIYERFYRVVQDQPAEARSGGLGLAIAQVIVSSHGGSIRCLSMLGKGSTFTVSLPMAPALTTPVQAGKINED